MADHALQHPSKHSAQDASFIKLQRSLLAATHWVSLTTGEPMSFSSSDKLLWLWMKDRHDFFKGRGGEWFDNQDAMAAAVGVSTATVKRLLKALEKHGYLTKRKRGLSNSYSINSDLRTMAVQSAQNDPVSPIGLDVPASMPAPAPEVSQQMHDMHNMYDDSDHDACREYYEVEWSFIAATGQNELMHRP